MPHFKFTAAALAILAFAAASPALAQRGGDDLLVGGKTSWKPAAAAQTGGGTVSDDVIVDGRIITGENPASAAAPFDPQFTGGVSVATGSNAPAKGGGSFGIDDGGFRGGARAADGAKPAQGGGSFAYDPTYRGGVRVDAADTNGGSRHTGGAHFLLGDGSVRGLSSNIGTGGFDAPKGGSLGSLNDIGSIGQLGGPGIAGAAGAKTATVAPLGVARAGGDAKGDGIDDIITGAGPGGGPHVKSGAGLGGGPHVKTFDATRSAGPAPGGGPQVKVFSGSTNAAAGTGATTALRGQALRTK